MSLPTPIKTSLHPEIEIPSLSYRVNIIPSNRVTMDLENEIFGGGDSDLSDIEEGTTQSLAQ